MPSDIIKEIRDELEKRGGEVYLDIPIFPFYRRRLGYLDIMMQEKEQR